MQTGFTSLESCCLPGTQVKDVKRKLPTVVQVVFSSIPPVARNKEGRNRKSQQINTLLRARMGLVGFRVL